MLSEPGAATPRVVCGRCRRPASVCYCHALPRLDTATRVVILQHPRERDMPIGTARMASLCLPRAELRVGIRWSAELLAGAIGDPARPAILLYPGPGARDILRDPPAGPVTLIVVDGTWSQARTVVRDNPVLQALPRYAFATPEPSQYRIRREPRAEYVSTIEALMHVLGALEGEPARFRSLLDPLRAMVDAQLACQARSPRRTVRQVHRPRPPRRVVPDEIVERFDDLVCVVGEANAWPYRGRRRAGHGESHEAGHGESHEAGTGESHGESHEAGRESGYGESQEAGHESGYGESQEAGHESGYGEGQRAGHESGYGESQRAGHGESQRAGHGESQRAGHGESQRAGHGESQRAGHGESQRAGRESGYEESQRASHGENHEAGHKSSDEIVHWVAHRVATGETFEQIVAPAGPLSPSTAFHIELAEAAILGGGPRGELGARFARFARATDLLCAWGHHGLDVAIAAGVTRADRLDLRAAAHRVANRKLGSLEDYAATLGPPPTPLAPGRAGRRLALLVQLVHAWRAQAAAGR